VKKETLITAIVFLGVGFLAGYALNAHRSSIQRQRESMIMTPAAGSQPASDSASAMLLADQASSTGGSAPLASQLPKGHPPITDAEVIQFFKDASTHNPADPSPRLKLADFLYDRRRFEEAIPWYQQALSLDPKNADARTDMATCYFNLGRARQAIDQLHQALKIDPRHGPTLFNLVVVNTEGLHDYAAARRALKRLAAMNPSYPGLAQLKHELNEATDGASAPSKP
jgi:tetratricopeptide (TPR) repeat protein